MQTSLESPKTRILVNPLLRAYLNPSITARYSATLFVAIPNPSRNLQIYKKEKYSYHRLTKRTQKYPPKTDHTKFPSSVLKTAPAPACPGFPLDAPSNSRIHVRCNIIMHRHVSLTI
ncbi:hypothetical protein HanRHA438_Chr17g0804871 [Helianthus annuus]|nr:hypothetical protein HanRHA438_Chr17g0804871 [Helianthus annuus]